MFAAQSLESDIVIILTFHHETCPDTPEETLLLIKTAKEEFQKLPFGQLMKPLKKRVSITTQQESILTDALKLRNDLAHNFLSQNYQKIVNPDRHASLISEIQSATASLNSAENELKPYLTAIYTAFTTALAEKPETAESVQLQSLLERLLAPALPFPAIA